MIIVNEPSRVKEIDNYIKELLKLLRMLRSRWFLTDDKVITLYDYIHLREGK